MKPSFDIDRFLSKVEKTRGCWIWTGSRYWDGYGMVSISKKTLRAHRVSYELFVGEIPAGMHVLHRCDVPACVNPEHLWVGTHRDNMRDMEGKRRHTIGGRHGMAKLTASDVSEMRRLHGSQGVAISDLAAKFSVSRSHVSSVLRNKFWRHLS